MLKLDPALEMSVKVESLKYSEVLNQCSWTCDAILKTFQQSFEVLHNPFKNILVLRHK